MKLVEAAAELFQSPSRSFAVELWDGTVLAPSRDEGVCGRVVVRHPRALAGLLPPASERRLAEAFLAGDVEIEGDAIGVLEAAGRWEGPRLRAATARAALALTTTFPTTSTASSSTRRWSTPAATSPPAASRSRRRSAPSSSWSAASWPWRAASGCSTWAAGGVRCWNTRLPSTR
jgi:hypothetical protein